MAVEGVKSTKHIIVAGTGGEVKRCVKFLSPNPEAIEYDLTIKLERGYRVFVTFAPEEST